MDSYNIAIDYRDPAWIAIAFLSGLLFRQINLPPMIGFLVAGFILHLFGAESDQFLASIADMGITLLLFTIGLKLRLSTLLRPEIWATTGLHMGATVILAAAFIAALGWAGFLLFDGMDYQTALIIAFALSFSSTVFAVKTLEDRGSLMSRYGQAAIGILVMQDIAAVVFLAFSAGKLPSIWAVSLLALIPARHMLGYLMERSGYGELLAVFGFSMALGGAALFELVGMKGDLGALALGALLASHTKAKHLANILMNFKDVFLVCFFLSIGLTGLPTWETTATAMVLLILIPIKTLLFTWLLTRFRMRGRGSTFGGLVLGNYSEFGLIVIVIAIGADWLAADWLTVIALALSISLIISSAMNVYALEIYSRFSDAVARWETRERLIGDEDIDLRGHRILIFGMGRVGRAAYDEMRTHAEDKIVGIDLDETQVERNCDEGRNVVLGDATNSEFWSRLVTPHADIEMILLSMSKHQSNIDAARQMRERGYKGPIVSTSLFPDQEQELLENGIDEVFNIYDEAGSGAATRMHGLLESQRP